MEEADDAAELEPIDFTIAELEDVNLVGFSNDQDLLQVAKLFQGPERVLLHVSRGHHDRGASGCN